MSRFHKIQEVAEAVQHSQIDTEIAWTCLQCRIDAFDSLADMRLHHKTDWHLYNVHRSLKALGPVTQDEYDATDDLSSIDGSEDDQDDPNHQDSILASGSPYVRFVYDQTVNGVSRPFQLSVFKQVLLSRKSNMLVPSEWVDALVRAQSSGQKTWVLMMLASGHFSGAVLDLSTGKAIATKSFHRYTTRKKQGGAQSGNDNSKGKAKSAGAGIRRYNEAALQQEILELLIEWKSHIANSELVFIRAAGNNQKVIFGGQTFLNADDPRIRSFPFTTRRPTNAELMRCFNLLVEAKIEPYDPKPIIELKGKTVKEANPKTHMEYNLEPVVAPEPPITDMQKHVLDCIKRGKIDALKSCGLDPDNVSQEFDDFHGTSFLHFAASCGKPDIVSFLLQLGADPTIKTQKKNQKAYDVSATKEVRDEFRRFMGSFPDRWDYSKTSIPGPLTDEIEQRQKEKERERRKKEKERKKLNKSNSSIVVEQKPSSSRRAAGQSISKTELQSIGMSSELRAKLDREKRYYLVI